jgi:transglutaminase-like putative cysteine protease
MKKKIVLLSFILVFIILFSAGCTELLTLNSKIIYQAHPTKVSYTISYGYTVNLSGTGEYTLLYDCDEPEALKGYISSVTSSNLDYTLKTIATFNQVRSWNIKSDVTKDYDLGITANVISESFIVSDINGKYALTIEEIQNQHPDIVSQYTKTQSKDDIIYLNPMNPEIINIINSIEEENSFIFAKKLFIWLKQNTVYQIHLFDNEVQTSDYTLVSRSGDCDDLSFLYISLCRAAGIPARFIRGFLLVDSNPIAHAWAEVFVGRGVGNDGWIPVECAGTSSSIDVEVHQNFGVENCEHLRVFKDDGTDESLNASLLGFYSKYDITRNIEAVAYAKVNNYFVLQSNKLVIDEEKGNRYYN